MNDQLGTAVITGASSGIGAVYADRLAERGHDVILIARNEQRLNDVAAKVRAKHTVNVQTLAADLSSPHGLAKVEDLLRNDTSITHLVNNAGVGAAAPLIESDVEKMQEMIAINITAMMRLTYTILPLLIASGSGTIINIASIVAIAPELLNGVYGGTKAFVLAFSQSLKHELKDTGVNVQVVLPGATGTNFWETAGVGINNLPSTWLMSPYDLVDSALIDLDDGEFASIPSLQQAGEWKAYEAARQVMLPHLSNRTPAARYPREFMAD
jgi:uncharacterized protein